MHVDVAKGPVTRGAAGVLYRVFGILLSPVIAAALALSSVSVIGNALRLRMARLYALIWIKNERQQKCQKASWVGFAP